ncbi:MAG: folylpolyglutamate synthase [Candelina mexicana]|nr:MAG: folylpolyglutamate synthase [Candelina mexicana]
MIELGLARINRLLREKHLPWGAIHVAGTNGKGSICAYISAMLHAGHVSCGRFTSPHLIDRWDCITIQEKVVPRSLFQHVESITKQRNEEECIGASEFEILTATAFDIFTHEGIDIGVVEVGLGGRLDATNVLKEPLVTVISKIGKDHQSLLGNTLEDIAYQKAGILKRGVACVLDDTNSESVRTVIANYARQIGAGPIIGAAHHHANQVARIWETLSRGDYEEHQKANIYCAFQALRIALEHKHPDIDPWILVSALQDVQWPGRLQTISIKRLTGRVDGVLIDGAHNAQSARILGSFVDRRLRQTGQNVTWVLAASQGKAIRDILCPLIKPDDHVVAVEFGTVDGMPWVQPAAATEILENIKEKSGSGLRMSAFKDVMGALSWATETAAGGPLVVAGSLYLVSDVMRLFGEIEDGAGHIIRGDQSL